MGVSGFAIIMEVKQKRTIGIIGVLIALLFVVPSAQSIEFSSTNYKIDAAALGAVGGASGSGNYQLQSSGGEAAIGNGASGSYKLAAGYAAQIIEPDITISIQPEGLRNYYPLNENIGSVVLDAGIESTLGSFVGSPTWGAGKLGQALTFNGTNQAINFDNTTQAQLTNGTIQSWVKTSSATGTVTTLGKYGAWELQLVAGKPSLYNFSNSTTCSAPASIANGAWRHVAVTLQTGVSNGSFIYVDGVQVAACTWTVSVQTARVSIGSRLNGATNSAYFPGSIDHVKIFNRVLSSTEIKAEYDAQNAGIASGLTLGTVTPGISGTTSFDIATLSSGSSYTLAVSQSGNLTQGASTIPGVSGTIASPIAWTEGTTKGLGFSLVSASATAIDAKWIAGTRFAALPGSATTVYNRQGLQTGSKDTVKVRLKLDVNSSQPSGSYSNNLIVTGTAAP